MGTGRGGGADGPRAPQLAAALTRERCWPAQHEVQAISLNAIVTIVDGAAQVARLGAEAFVAACEDAQANGHRFRAALSGGDTPRPAYSLLGTSGADGGLRERVEWEQTELFFVDERAVPPGHPDSNYGMVREALLSRLDERLPHVHRMEAEQAPDEAAWRYEETLRTEFRLAPGERPAFDLILLGLGTDAHTGSLFPGSSALDERLRLVVAAWVEKLQAWRITLTPPVLDAARRVLFLVSGSSKASAVASVLEGDGDIHQVPAKIVRPEGGELRWILDRAAAADLRKDWSRRTEC